MIRFFVLILAGVLLSVPAFADCRNVMISTQSYTACMVDVQKQMIGLYNLDAGGEAYGGFDNLQSSLDQAYQSNQNIRPQHAPND